MPQEKIPGHELQLEFTLDDLLHSWNITAKDWLIKHRKDKEWDGLATASVVFNPEGKILLLQRAAHDSMPNRWELPGGAVDDDDPSILYGAARELLEEAGLVAKHFRNLVMIGSDRDLGQVFPNSTRTKMWCRFTFWAEVEDCDAVKLDANEHQDFVWASEAEVRQESTVDRKLPITHAGVKTLILEAFRVKTT